MTAAAAARVRTYLLQAGFTSDGVLARVGSPAFAALGRGLLVPVRRSLSTGTPQPLDRLIEALLLADPVAADSFPGAVAADLETLGILRRHAEHLVPEVQVHPYGEADTDWFIVSDLGPPERPDHVLGLGGASLTLARITPRRDVGRTLDLGCGSGVQSLHAARHSTLVVATDLNPRALALSVLSATLSGFPADQLDLREGWLFEPVSDERFDLVVSNPPFVISPAHRFTYRDAGLPGDELSRRVVAGAAEQLSPGGVGVILGNWMHLAGADWRDRVIEWVSGTGVSAWIVQRDAQPVADYAATWLRDAQVPEGPEFDEGMAQCLDAFAEESCQQVGFGWIVLVAPGPGGRDPWVLVEDLAHGERLPGGDEVLAFLAGCAQVEQLTVSELLAAPARLVTGATVTTTAHVLGAGDEAAEPPCLGLAGSVGSGGWRPGLPVPPALLAALLADGATPIGERLDAAAHAEGVDPLDILGPALTGLRELVRMGIVRTD